MDGQKGEDGKDDEVMNGYISKRMVCMVPYGYIKASIRIGAEKLNLATPGNRNYAMIR